MGSAEPKCQRGLPKYREQSQFRYLGRWTAPGQDYFVVAFAQRPDGTDLRSHIQIATGNQSEATPASLFIPTSRTETPAIAASM